MLVCIVSLIGLFTLTVSGAESDAAPTRSLKISCFYDSEPIEGVGIQIYQVASIKKDGTLELTDAFRQYPVDLGKIQDHEWEKLAETLSAYVLRDKLPAADQGVSDKTGIVRFPNAGAKMPSGLYLVVGNSVRDADYNYQTVPFLISLPSWDSGSSDREQEVTAFPKFQKNSIPNDPARQTTERKVIKVWKNDTDTLRPEKIVIQLLKNNEIYATVQLNKQNQWRYYWKSLPKYDEEGREIRWTIAEQGVENYTVSLTQTGDAFVLTNMRVPNIPDGPTVQVQAQKMWDDKGHEAVRPGSVTVYLYADGKLYDTQELNKENGWHHEWNELPKTKQDGTLIAWDVKEKYTKGYRVQTFQNGNYFEITNKFIEEKLPQTGMLWWPVPILALVGAVLLSLGIVTRKRHHE